MVTLPAAGRRVSRGAAFRSYPSASQRLLAAVLLLPAGLLAPGGWITPAALQAEEPAATPAAAQTTNHLAGENSLYLRMHAHNPVDWRPWGEEALTLAKREKKPIFLSIGYSSCHWCHVMERETFVDKEIAAYLNKHFICIKVDREERPDVDDIYMTSLHVFAQLSKSGKGGGWPLSMFLTPDAKPFFGGTYFPARDGDRAGATGFFTLIQKIEEVWEANPENIHRDADLLTRVTRQQLAAAPPALLTPPTAATIEACLEALAEDYDPRYGGFRFSEDNPNVPKFPEPSNLIFLFGRAAAGKDSPDKTIQQQGSQALAMATGTLDHIAQGGIRDHIGGGFHRYSVDRFWRIPHFEKMLYDNGQLASAYALGYAATGNEAYAQATRELLDFLLREMTSPAGGFYAAIDAESEDEEGKFYRWTKEELQSRLTPAEFTLLAAVYGVDNPPNFEDEYYALQLDQPLSRIAEARGLKEAQLNAQLEPIRKKLLAVRDQRERPLTDTKILTGWNGLMIRGLADAGRLLQEPRYLAAAEKAADLVLTKLRQPDGRLLRSYSEGEAKLNAYLTDYAFLVDGLLALHEATGEQRWLTAADKIMALQLELFWDDKFGGFYFTSDDHEELLARTKREYDGAIPAGGSVSVDNLVNLAQRLDRPEYLAKARQTVNAAGGLLANSPGASPRMVHALARLLEVEALQEKKAPVPAP
ncbi:thioredoxin domain-containing protein [Lignipirellula cremea]|uniref:Spermatogenesis-associated protein 20-like TRX domain-containing protein n=1 Tax=Lignipirellula cremea TaxID=2528010 RepID=A0A518DMG8_9BACT|nr:thioredoxin domain-containing protein [Lignipirellula cremea]QDU93023.1 hypothetical protein Pla8534_07980 [Lignipirellula cremea]